MPRHTDHDRPDTGLLLTDLAQDGRNYRRVEISNSSRITSHSLQMQTPGFQGQDDDLEDDSSSDASFMTCSQAEISQCIPAQGIVNNDARRTRDNSLDGETLTEAHQISDSISVAKEARSGDQNDPTTEKLLPLTSEPKYADHGRQETTSRLQSVPVTALRRDSQVSELSTRNKDRSPPGDSPEANPKAPQEIRKPDMREISIKTTNELGHKNLAELYARFDTAHVQELQADLLEIGARKTHDQDLAIRITDKAFEDLKKMQCEFCERFFTPEQNVRELDNGSNPCSHHPGKTHTMNDSVMWTDGFCHVLGVPDWNIRLPRDGIHGWTCCLRRISLSEMESGPQKTPGCATTYHNAMEKTRCCLCDRLFTDGDNKVQPDGSSPCSYHPGKLLPELIESSDKFTDY